MHWRNSRNSLEGQAFQIWGLSGKYVGFNEEVRFHCFNFNVTQSFEHYISKCAFLWSISFSSVYCQWYQEAYEINPQQVFTVPRLSSSAPEYATRYWLFSQGSKGTHIPCPNLQHERYCSLFDVFCKQCWSAHVSGCHLIKGYVLTVQQWTLGPVLVLPICCLFSRFFVFL